ncbi:MAG: hypothetical protein H0X24_02750 [Ktedonobacterales bacterium]|nr:hypothetical protein [Ktedonobacterales bacterium]
MTTMPHTIHQFSLSSQLDEQYQSTCNSASSTNYFTQAKNSEVPFHLELLAEWLTPRPLHDARAWLESHLVELCCPYIIALLTAMIYETPSSALARELRWRRDVLLWTQHFGLDVAWHVVEVRERELLGVKM